MQMAEKELYRQKKEQVQKWGARAFKEQQGGQAAGFVRAGGPTEGAREQAEVGGEGGEGEETM